MSLREKKKQSAHDAMVRATVRLSLERGFDAVTVDEIAAAAWVSRRTFFRYFRSKEAAFFDVQEQRMKRFAAALAEQRPGERPYARVRRVLLDMAAEYDAHREELCARHRTILASPNLYAYELEMDRRYEAVIVEQLTPVNANDDDRMRARVLGFSLFGVVRAALGPWLEAENPAPMVEVGAKALDMLEEGLAPESELSTQAAG